MSSAAAVSNAHTEIPVDEELTAVVNGTREQTRFFASHPHLEAELRAELAKVWARTEGQGWLMVLVGSIVAAELALHLMAITQPWIFVALLAVAALAVVWSALKLLWRRGRTSSTFVVEMVPVPA